ncbi:MAG: hypothetical protein ABFD18_19170 [Syntrophomonas sp.]
MADAKKTGARSNMSKASSGIHPIDDPVDAIDFYMPLPDDVYKKWK